MELREYKSTDCEQMAQLFYNTVHSVNVKDYRTVKCMGNR
jgi:putative acetyltransferase